MDGPTNCLSTEMVEFRVQVKNTELWHLAKVILWNGTHVLVDEIVETIEGTDGSRTDTHVVLLEDLRDLDTRKTCSKILLAG